QAFVQWERRRVVPASENTRQAAENAWPMKSVASVHIGVASPKVSAANSAPPRVAPSSMHTLNSAIAASAVKRPAVKTVATQDSHAIPSYDSASPPRASQRVSRALP